MLTTPTLLVPAIAPASFSDGLNAVDGFIWSKYLLIPLLLGSGIILTWRLRGIQLRKLGPALRFAFLQRDGGAEGRARAVGLAHQPTWTGSGTRRTP